MVRLLAIAMSLILLFGLVHFLSAWIVRQYQQAQEAAEREAAALRSFARLGLAINVVSHDMPGFTGELRHTCTRTDRIFGNSTWLNCCTM